MTEPLLQEDINRYTLFPILHEDIWNAYKTHQLLDWRAEEIDYSADLEDWSKLESNERKFIEHILAFFAGADGIVLENLSSNFAREVQWAEARAFYSFQANIEQIHSEVYSRLIDTYITDSTRKDELFRGIETIPCIQKKAEWAMKWMDPSKASFAERLVAFAVVEGVFFCGSFCAIYWLKNRHIMTKALGTSNEFIARDESLHCKFALLLYGYLVNKLSQEQIHAIFKEAVDIETEFITDSIPCDMVGMNKQLMTEYIQYVADFWMTDLLTNSGKRCQKLYNTKNPFSFMDMIGLEGKTNFFEKRVSEYSKTPHKSSERLVADEGEYF